METKVFEAVLAAKTSAGVTSISSGHKLELLYLIDARLPQLVVGDSLRLKQVIINLINNAIKFTYEGEVFIHLFLSKLLDNGGLEIGISVRDTGIGIPKDKLSGLFNAFSQVDSSTTRKYGGTGLGLTISERLVKLMGGRMWVESIVGIGSTFYFTIKAQNSQSPNYKDPFTPVTATFTGKKVLVVDANATQLLVLKTQLEQWNLTVKTCSSATAALETLKTEGNFSLVLTSINLEGMNGVELAGAIKSIQKSLPVILLKAPRDAVQTEYFELFAAVLPKPVKQNILWKNICAQIAAPLLNDTNSEKKQSSLLSSDFARQYPFSILIAEDNLINQKLVERILNKLGYTVAIAGNGLEALEKVVQHTYDVIFMDIQMPEMDGLEATRKIRELQIPQPYIIALTANALAEDREICLSNGMDNYLSKPMKIEGLVEVLKDVPVAVKS